MLTGLRLCGWALQPRLVSEDQCLAEGYGRRVEATLRRWLRQLDEATNGDTGRRPTPQATLGGGFCEGLVAATNKRLEARFRINTMAEFEQYVCHCAELRWSTSNA